MRRVRYALAAAFLPCLFPGCAEETQPNPAATNEQVNKDFGVKSAEMMKNANAGMDPSKLKAGGAAAKK